MRELLRSHRRFFFLITLAALALRLFFILKFPVVAGDSVVYADIAKNWLHGVYGVTNGSAVSPTLIRLPGYPLFLAAVFKLFGENNFTIVLYLQGLLDVVTCFVVAATALRMARTRLNQGADESRPAHAAMAAFALAALCPFTANYTATGLTETWAIFLTALTLYCATRGYAALRGTGNTLWWLACGVAGGLNIMFRPDGALLPSLCGGALAVEWWRGRSRTEAFKAAALLACGVLLLVAPWTVRNWRVMHVFQPLAPRYGLDPKEFEPQGFNRWVKTWMVDYRSVADVYWKVDGEKVDLESLPPRAIDNQNERRLTQEAIDAYNDELAMTPGIDAMFARLAEERVRRHPVRYYAWLPALRMADMWLRPRTEMLDLDPDWWNYDDHPEETLIAIALGAANLLLVLLAVAGVWPALRMGNQWVVVLMLVLVAARTVFLSTVENPEPRYTLECFPALFVLAATAIAALRTRRG